jgi:hypothetical protein
MATAALPNSRRESPRFGGERPDAGASSAGSETDDSEPDDGGDEGSISGLRADGDRRFGVIVENRRRTAPPRFDHPLTRRVRRLHAEGERSSHPSVADIADPPERVVTSEGKRTTRVVVAGSREG